MQTFANKGILTVGKCNGTLASPQSHQSQEDTLRLLEPLLRGKSVALQVNDPRAVRRPRIGVPLLFIVPGEQFGDSKSLMFALQGERCEVQRKTDIRADILVRIGLPARASNLLAKALKSLYGRPLKPQ